jgi:hypothetical protein
MTKESDAVQAVVYSQYPEQSLQDGLLTHLHTRLLQQDKMILSNKRALEEKDSEVDALKKQKTTQHATDQVRIAELQFMLQRSTAAELPWSELAKNLKARCEARDTEILALKKELEEAKNSAVQVIGDSAQKQKITELSKTNLDRLTTINQLRKDLREMKAKATKDAETIANFSASTVAVAIKNLETTLSITQLALKEASDAVFRESEKAEVLTQDKAQLNKKITDLSEKNAHLEAEIAKLKLEADPSHKYLSFPVSPQFQGEHSTLHPHAFFESSSSLIISVTSPPMTSSIVTAPMSPLKI